MKELNFLVDNVAKNILLRVLLQDTEKQFMKESNFLVDNVAKNLQVRVILRNTEG